MHLLNFAVAIILGFAEPAKPKPFTDTEKAAVLRLRLAAVEADVRVLAIRVGETISNAQLIRAELAQRAAWEKFVADSAKLLKEHGYSDKCVFDEQQNAKCPTDPPKP